DSQRAVGQRHQHATVRDAPRVEVLFLDAHADHQALAFILRIERAERGQERAAPAPELPEAMRDAVAHARSPSRSMRPFASARSAWRAITRTQSMRLAKRGSRVCPSTYRL